jgi:hypothetical protein
MLKSQGQFKKRTASLAIAVCLSLLLAPAQPASIAANLDVRIEAHRKQGLPFTLKELEKWHAYPKGDNAADVYLEAFKLLVSPPPGESDLPFVVRSALPPRGEPLPAKTITAIRKFSATNRPAMKLLHEAAKIKNCRYPIDLREGFELLSPHYSQLKRAGQLFNLEALRLVEDDRMDQAVEQFAAAFAAADSLASEPTVIAQLLRMRIDGYSCEALEHILNRRRLDNSQLKRLSRIFIGRKKPGMITGALIGDLCSARAYYNGSPELWAAFLAEGEKVTADELKFFRSREYARHTKADHRFYLGVMMDLIDASRQPFPACFITTKKVKTRFESIAHPRRYAGTGAFYPALDVVFDVTVEHAAILRSAGTAIAIERWRHTNDGNLPESLSELVPDYLDSVPTDPFDGKPLRYRRLPKGYVVYSIGNNRMDDQGSEESIDEADRRKRDLIFRVER